MRSHLLLLGHRGVRGHKYRVRENTIEAFDLAMKHGCDGFEFDVRLTGDGYAVVCHNTKSRGANIAQAMAARITHLPGLNQILDRYADRAFLDIELKVGGLESCLLAALAAHRPRREYVVSSFLPEVLHELRSRDKSIPLGIICETRHELSQWSRLAVEYVIVKESLIKPELVRTIHAAGRKLFAWTVNRKSSMLRLAAWRVDGIISDKTDVMVSTLAGSGAE